MKEGWRMVKFSEVAQVVGGSTPKTNVKSFWNGDNYWVTPAELKGEKYINKTERTITDEAISKTNLTLLPKGTVLLSSRAPIGKVCITNVPMFCNQGFKNIVCKDSLYNEFVYYYLLYSVPYLESLGTGATFKEISKRVVENVEIPLPPLKEQHRIVSILDASFEKIDTLKKNAEENLKNAKALFQQVLAQELKPKEGWVEKKLGDIFKFIDYRGSTPTKISSGIPLITAKNVRMGYLDYTIKDFISQEEYFARQSRGISRKGDLLFTTEAPLGNVALADLEEYSAGQRVITFQQYPDGININNKFYLWYLMSPNFQKNIRDLATGLTAQGIKAKILKDIVVYYPSIDEQNNIANTLDTLSEKCRRLEEVAQQTIRECDALKQSILRQAFSGEL